MCPFRRLLYLKLLLVGCLVPVWLHFASSQYVHLKFTAQLVQGIDLHSVCKNPQAIEVFYYNAYTVIRFNSWCLAICCFLPEIINLPNDLILCTRFMLCYLERHFNKVGVVISQQGSSILSLYQHDQFSCRWSGPAVEVPSASIKLSQLGPETASCFGFWPSTTVTSMTIFGRSPFVSMAPIAVVIVWSVGVAFWDFWVQIWSEIGCYMCGPTSYVCMAIYDWPIFLQSGVLLSPSIPTCNRRAAWAHLIPPTHLICGVTALIGRMITRGGG